MPWRATRSFLVEPPLPAALVRLAALSRNLCWTWMPGAPELFERVDPELWRRSGQNPVRLLQAVNVGRWAQLAEDPEFMAMLEGVSQRFEGYLSRPRAVFGNLRPDAPAAYFSLEFALAEALPNYAGGLGVLAGDHLRSASDLAVPLVAVGLFYRQGYFQQQLGPDGYQQETYVDISPAEQPFDRPTGADGQPLTVSVPFPGRDVICNVWRVDVGLVPVYLLDSDHPANPPEVRTITSRLYNGDMTNRIQQEMILGIGGVRALEALQIRPVVFHMNEGHSALLGLERIRTLMEASGASFAEARLPVAASTAFTTHTAVEAGIDVFPVELASEHLARVYSSLGLGEHEFVTLGQEVTGDNGHTFSMAVLGLRMSEIRNGVSQIHGGVARRLWHCVWPNVPEENVPIAAVNNGIHLPTWVAPEVAGLFDEHLGPSWRHDPAAPGNWEALQALPDERLWQVRNRLRARLGEQVHSSMAARADRLGRADRLPRFDPEALTIGFARRFAAYKRATLLFRDPARLASILGNSDRPVQIVFAGKAHPSDESGKHFLREVDGFAGRPEFCGRIFVAEQYGIGLARGLVQGCDVWLNTPLRPLEASGTSGMKAVANGALHLSVLDGWWADGYQDGLGWAIGGERSQNDRAAEDTLEAASLYRLLERDVIPMFYDRGPDGVPHRWLDSAKRSIAAYAPRFNTHRMVRDYLETAYLPAATAWERLTAEGLAEAKSLAAFLSRVHEAWPSVRILAVDDSVGEQPSARGPVEVEVLVDTGPLGPADIAVDVIHGSVDQDGGLVSATGLERAVVAEVIEGVGWRYRAAVRPRSGGRMGYAIRITPSHRDLGSPLDTGMVHWG